MLNALERLKRENAELRALLDAADVAALSVDRSLRVRTYTRSLPSVLDVQLEQEAEPIAAIGRRLGGVDLAHAIASVIERGDSIEQSIHGGDGAAFLMRVLPDAPTAPDSAGALVVIVDRSKMVAIEEQQRALLSELNHRVRNMLQVVISLCNQTLHRASDLKSFETAFMGRMQALARAYELLSRDSWRKASVRDLVRTQLAPFASEGRRYEAHGEPVELDPRAALPLGLALYELAANAAKYGALSTAQGGVELNWALVGEGAQRELFINWIEQGGPEVAPPTRRGFGSELITRQLTHELRGKASMDFRKEGLRVTLTIPAAEASGPD